MEPNSDRMDLNDAAHEPVDMEDDAQVLRAVRRAVAEALRTHKAKGQYIVTSQDGKPLIVAPEDIVVPDTEE